MSWWQFALAVVVGTAIGNGLAYGTAWIFRWLP